MTASIIPGSHARSTVVHCYAPKAAEGNNAVYYEFRIQSETFLRIGDLLCPAAWRVVPQQQPEFVDVLTRAHTLQITQIREIHRHNQIEVLEIYPPTDSPKASGFSER